MRLSLLFAIVAGSSVAAFGQLVDPVGFCDGPPSVAACTIATGDKGETISISGTSFYMEKSGSPKSPQSLSGTPWYLLIAVPETVTGSASQPGVTISESSTAGPPNFTAGTVTDVGAYLPTNSDDLYTFAGISNTDNSLNAANLFGVTTPGSHVDNNEFMAFGSIPTDFQVYEYTFSPAFDSGTPYLVTIGGSGLVNGTYVAAADGVGSDFSSTFTTAGLVGGPGGSGNGSGSPVPEPASVVLLGTISLFVASRAKKVLNRR